MSRIECLRSTINSSIRFLWTLQPQTVRDTMTMFFIHGIKQKQLDFEM